MNLNSLFHPGRLSSWCHQLKKPVAVKSPVGEASFQTPHSS